jgi:Ca-activated chloride channel family protein
LRPEDYFNVVLFRDTPKFFQTQRVPATRESIDAAKKFLENLESKGETDIYQGILPVVQEQPRPNSPGIVIVLSDGRPTIGIRDSRTIINALSSDNRLRNTIFAFGGGNTVNRQMLDLLAYRNKGDADVVEDFNAIDDQFPNYFRRLNSPLLINLTADFGGINTKEVYPKIISDFYMDKPVTLYGRYDAAQDSTFVVRLTGHATTDQKEVIFKAKLNEATQGKENIAQRWAFQKAYYLIGEMSLQGETPELLSQLRGLSQQYKIRTSYDD